MDSVFTSDGIPVIWHDVGIFEHQGCHGTDANYNKSKHNILATKCKGDYVGQFIANLTLAQVKTMDCGLQLVDFPQAQGKHISPSKPGIYPSNASSPSWHTHCHSSRSS